MHTLHTHTESSGPVLTDKGEVLGNEWEYFLLGLGFKFQGISLGC